MIKFVSDLRQVHEVGGFRRIFEFSSTNKTDRHDIAEILLKVALNTINQQNQPTNLYHKNLLTALLNAYESLWSTVKYV